MKIWVLGESGSGKSWMTRHLSEKLQLPLVELDRLWIGAGGLSDYPKPSTESVKEKMRNQLAALLKNEGWVVDGNYRHLHTEFLKEADVVIFMDVSFHRRLINLLGRELRGENKSDGYSLKNTFASHLPKVIVKGNRGRQKNLRAISSHPKSVIISNRREAVEIIEKLQGANALYSQ